MRAILYNLKVKHFSTKKNRIILLISGIGGLVFYFKSRLYIDPDLGWHLRTGEYILKFGFPHNDPFSYTLSDFLFIPHSWLSEVIYWKLYTAFDSLSILGQPGLELIHTLSAISAALTVYITLKIVSTTDISQKIPASLHVLFLLIPSMLLVGHLLPYVGTRPQTFSWLMFIFLFAILASNRLWQKYKYVVPIIFVIWAQLHGGFAIGIGILCLKIAVETLKNKGTKIPSGNAPRRKNLIVLLLSVCITLINPFGPNLWREVVSTLISPSVRLGINEWTPIILSFDPRLFIVMILSLVYFIRYRKLFSPFVSWSYIFLTFSMLSASKLFPFWLIVAVIVVGKGQQYMLKQLVSTLKPSWVPTSMRRLILLNWGIAAAVGVNIAILAVATAKTYSQLAEEVYYPRNCVIYLKGKQKDNTHNQNIFAPFGWGGYLLWKLPEKKVFIDGRMPYWDNVLKNYHEIITLQQPFQDVAKTYNITTVLVQKNKTKFEEFAASLEQSGWKRTYEDDVCYILTGP